MKDTNDRIVGTLLGTALGDALGLPVEGLPPRTIAKRFGRMDRFRLFGRTGFVSDDTEQSALVAQSILKAPEDATTAANAFRRSLIGWFWRLPWGIGLATLRACCRSMVGLRPSGVRSAGNGAAMRSAIIGVAFADDQQKLVTYATRMAEVTHTDPRAVEGAVFVAALAGECARSETDAERSLLVERALAHVRESSLRSALEAARELAARGASTEEAARALGNTGFVLHTLPFAVFFFLRFGGAPMQAITETISGGGDTDSIAAIVGAWVGALHGEQGLSASLIAQIHDGPFGPTHLRALGTGLARLREERSAPVPRYSALGAMVRNVALFPVILGHGLRRLVPF